MFIFQWLARSLGSFELDIFGKLENWFFDFFPGNFITDTWKFRKNQTFSNTKSIHFPRTSTSPGFIWTRYIWRTQKLIFWVLLCNCITETWDNFQKKYTFRNTKRIHLPMSSTSPGFIWTRYICKTPKLIVFGFFQIHLSWNFEKMTKVCSFSNY